MGLTALLANTDRLIVTLPVVSRTDRPVPVLFVTLTFVKCNPVPPARSTADLAGGNEIQLISNAGISPHTTVHNEKVN